jgi:hypothetical protein
MNKNDKIKKVMREFKNGKLKTADGKLVTDKKQALAIAMSESEDYSEKSIMSNIEINSLSEAEDIIKSAGTEDLFEKAHNVGDVHPNGKWVWTQLSNGKFDWRTIKKNKGTQAPTNNQTSTQAPTKATINNQQSVSNNQNKITFNDISDYIKNNNSKLFISRLGYEGDTYPSICIDGYKKELLMEINKMNNVLGTNFSINDFRHDKSGNRNLYGATFNTHTGKLYQSDTEAEKDRPEAEDKTKDYKKYQTKLNDDFKDDLDYVLTLNGGMFGKPKYIFVNKNVKIKAGTQNDKGEFWMNKKGSHIGQWMTKDEISKEASNIRHYMWHSKLTEEKKKDFPKGSKFTDNKGREYTVTKQDSITGKIRFTRIDNNGKKKHKYIEVARYNVTPERIKNLL